MMVASYEFEIKPYRKQPIIDIILILINANAISFPTIITTLHHLIIQNTRIENAENIPLPNINDFTSLTSHLKTYSINNLLKYANSLGRRFDENFRVTWKYNSRMERLKRLKLDKETRIRIAELTKIIEPKHFYNNLWRNYCRHSERKEDHQINHELTPQNEKEIVCKIDYTECEIIEYIQKIEKNLPNYELYTRMKQIPTELVGLINGYLEDPEEMIIKSIMESFEVMHIHIENESHRKRFINWILHEYIPKYSTLPVNISKTGQLIIKL